MLEYELKMGRNGHKNQLKYCNYSHFRGEGPQKWLQK